MSDNTIGTLSSSGTGANSVFNRFCAGLKNQDLDRADVSALLGALGALPPDAPQMPVLGSLTTLTRPGTATTPDSAGGMARSGTAIAANVAGAAAAIMVTRSGLIGERLHRRYLRICAVQDELGKLDFNKAKPGAALNDFVFDQADFSVYKKITAEAFSLFSGPGLDDFGAPFFAKAFALDREKTGALVNNAYRRIGAFYYIKQEKLLFNPLLMAVMRTLHTSLEFTPVFTGAEILTECTALLRYLTEKNIVGAEILSCLSQAGESTSTGIKRTCGPTTCGPMLFFRLLEALDGVCLEHPDGMKTELSAVKATVPAPSQPAASAATDTRITLKGTFHPRGKAYTIPLVYMAAGQLAAAAPKI
ncbi:hypothetical protein AGMMS50267_02280 [Spirochaetia bacterium]|nr:hypothetical protein AGMMS50267_02280 [Spirochaetia bacterium]